VAENRTARQLMSVTRILASTTATYYRPHTAPSLPPLPATPSSFAALRCNAARLPWRTPLSGLVLHSCDAAQRRGYRGTPALHARNHLAGTCLLARARHTATRLGTAGAAAGPAATSLLLNCLHLPILPADSSRTRTSRLSTRARTRTHRHPTSPATRLSIHNNTAAAVSPAAGGI